MLLVSGNMDIDDMIADDESKAVGQSGGNKELEYMFPPVENTINSQEDNSIHKVLVGRVEHFFDKINVAAIQLSGNLRVGDVIEIGNENESLRLQVTSMQINKEKVETASDGDSVGIKVDKPVNIGSNVYVMPIPIG